MAYKSSGVFAVIVCAFSVRECLLLIGSSETAVNRQCFELVCPLSPQHWTFCPCVGNRLKIDCSSVARLRRKTCVILITLKSGSSKAHPLHSKNKGKTYLYCFTVHFHISISFYQHMHFYCD